MDFQQAVCDILRDSGFVRNASQITKDGWGNPFNFFVDKNSRELRFTSEKYEAYCSKKQIKTEYPWEDQDQEP